MNYICMQQMNVYFIYPRIYFHHFEKEFQSSSYEIEHLKESYAVAWISQRGW